MELTPPYVYGQDGVLRMPKIRKTKTLLLQWYNEDQAREIKEKRQYQHSIMFSQMIPYSFDPWQRNLEQIWMATAYWN